MPRGAIGWGGTIAIFLAYFLITTRKIEASSKSYQLLNVAGAMGIIINSAVHGGTPSVGLNSARLLASYGLIKKEGNKHFALAGTASSGLKFLVFNPSRFSLKRVSPLQAVCGLRLDRTISYYLTYSIFCAYELAGSVGRGDRCSLRLAGSAGDKTEGAGRPGGNDQIKPRGYDKACSGYLSEHTRPEQARPS